jgi:nucleoside-triphosphatase
VSVLSSSANRALLLTGAPGSGKTTVLRRVAAGLEGRPVCGFLTEEIREGRERVGFRIETFNRESGVLAHVGIRSPYRVSRYFVDVATLDRIVAASLDVPDAEICLVDEIGKMESLSERFVRAIERLLDSHRLLVATIAARGTEWIEKIKAREDTELWTVTRSNRDGLPDEVLAWLDQRRGEG